MQLGPPGLGYAERTAGEPEGPGKPQSGPVSALDGCGEDPGVLPSRDPCAHPQAQRKNGRSSDKSRFTRGAATCFFEVPSSLMMELPKRHATPMCIVLKNRSTKGQDHQFF